MDALVLTAIATAILLSAVPGNVYVALRWYQAWRGGETIKYFAPTLAVMVGVAVASLLGLVVGVNALCLRYDPDLAFLPPGVGILLIAIGFILPSASMPWFLRLLREGQG